MPTELKPNYHHGDLRTALIDAAIEMIEEQGVDSVTMRSLSNWVGVSRTAAYRHFENKEALLTAIAIAGFEQFKIDLQLARLNPKLDEIRRFQEMGRAYIRFAIENTAHYRLMFGDTVTQQNSTLRFAAKETFNELFYMLETLQGLRLIATDDPRAQALYIWANVHGLASLIINNKLKNNDNLSTLIVFFERTTLSGLHFTPNS